MKRELGETKEELRVKLHQYSRQNRHFKELERKYRELTEMHNRLKDRMDEKENELQEKEKVPESVRMRREDTATLHLQATLFTNC